MSILLTPLLCEQTILKQASEPLHQTINSKLSIFIPNESNQIVGSLFVSELMHRCSGCGTDSMDILVRF
jgi:hypothetical protein